MLTALADTNRALSNLGATGMEIIVDRKQIYMPYGRRLEICGGPNRKLLRWTFRMVMCIQFWKRNSTSSKQSLSQVVGIHL